MDDRIQPSSQDRAGAGPKHPTRPLPPPVAPPSTYAPLQSPVIVETPKHTPATSVLLETHQPAMPTPKSRSQFRQAVSEADTQT